MHATRPDSGGQVGSVTVSGFMRSVLRGWGYGQGGNMPKTRTELTARLDTIEAGVRAGDERAVKRQHDEGKLTARERIAALLDPDSFVEEFMLAETHVTDFGMAERRLPTDGVVTGYGTVDGRLVFVYAQDRTVLAGAVGSAHGEKIAYV